MRHSSPFLGLNIPDGDDQFCSFTLLKERNAGQINWVLPRVLTFTTTQRIGVFASDGNEQECDNRFLQDGGFGSSIPNVRSFL